jgi:SOS-response transcriptional repressor LexA
MNKTTQSRRIAAMEFIRQHFRDWGASPSYSEIGAALGVERQRVGRILEQLETDGEILRTPNMPRGIRLPERIDQLSDTEIELILQRRGFTIIRAEV